MIPAELTDLAIKGQALMSERKELLSKGAALTDEQLTRVEAINGECVGIKAQIERARKLDAAVKGGDGFDAWMGESHLPAPLPGGGNSDGGSLMGFQPAGMSVVRDGKMLADMGPGIFGAKAWDAIASPDYTHHFKTYLRMGERMGPAAYKALEDGIDTQGGYLVPADFIQRLIQRKPTPTRIAGMVQRITTSRDTVVIPKVNYGADDLYTTGFRVVWTDEIPSSDTAMDIDDSNLFGTVKIPNYTAMIKGRLTNNQVEDAAFDVTNWLESKFSETIDLLRDNMILNGNGIQQPTGIIGSLTSGSSNVNAPATVKTGDANLLTADGVIKLAYSVPEQYEDNCKFVFNKTNTAQALRLLKDSQLRYMFGAGYQDSGLANAKPTNLVGYSYVYSGFMPNVAAGGFPILFGDLQGYTFVDRLGFSIQVLRELYAPRNQIGILGRVRFGGQLVEPWRLRAQLVST